MARWWAGTSGCLREGDEILRLSGSRWLVGGSLSSSPGEPELFAGRTGWASRRVRWGLTNAGRARRNARPLAQLRTLQAEYDAWRDRLPESRADSRTAELIEGVYDVDLDALRRRIPAGVRGRD